MSSPVTLVGLNRRQGTPQTLDSLVVDVAATGLVMVLGGLGASLLLTLVDVLTRERWRWLHRTAATCCPEWGRRLVLTVCGVGMVWPVATAPSLGADDGRRDCRPACAVRVHGLPMPDLPAPQPSPRHVVVRPGDCLWALAARELGPQASDADVARSVDAWYAANAATIGPDPDLIFPGTRLDRPEVSP